MISTQCPLFAWTSIEQVWWESTKTDNRMKRSYRSNQTMSRRFHLLPSKPSVCCSHYLLIHWIQIGITGGQAIWGYFLGRVFRRVLAIVCMLRNKSDYIPSGLKQKWLYTKWLITPSQLLLVFVLLFIYFYMYNVLEWYNFWIVKVIILNYTSIY